jgi:Tol biopolymer transport system component
VLVYAGAIHEVSQMAWRSRDGQESSAGIQPGNILNFRLSPDDTQVALSRVDPVNNTSDVWVVELQRAAPTRFTLNPMNDISPVWSPDGQRVAFRSDRTGGNLLFGKAFGAGSEEQALSREDVANPSDWSPDGRYVIFHQAVAITGLDVGMADLNNGGTRTFLANTVFDEYDGRVSPDGRWIAYVSEESCAPEVYAQSFPQAGGKWLMSAGGGTEPRWRHDGRELFYLAPSRQVMAVAVTASGSSIRAGSPKMLFQTPSTTYANPYQMSIEPTRDGTKFLVRSVASTAAASSSITIVLNWPSELAGR